MKQGYPVAREVVLVGGGHAHVHVLTAFAKQPEPGVRLTLVTQELDTPYSGMLPGLIAGLYTRQEVYIDLLRLCAATGTRLIHATADGLDRANKRVLLLDRPPFGYDLVSLDVGITPLLDSISGAAEHAIAVKPIGKFLAKYDALLERLYARNGPRRVVGIGGGAGGVELLLSLRHRVLDDAPKHGVSPDAFSFTLITNGPVLPTHNARVQSAFRRVFAAQGVRLLENRRACEIRSDAVLFADGDPIAADTVLVTTHAAAPGWLGDTGLSLDKSGFIAVGPTLQALNDPSVFAAGDCAALIETPREKAGVYAVRAGPPLARNLRLVSRDESPLPWRPQHRNLALMTTGGRNAIASRAWLFAEGDWVWSAKDWIDRRWMRMYQDVDRMIARMATNAGPSESPDDENAMRCGGCGAKIGPGSLSAALARLGPPLPDPHVAIGMEAADDAAVVRTPPDGYQAHSVDFFRAFIDDPFTFGEIAASHALNDIFAMAAVPRYALATAVVPHGARHVVEETLYQMLAGARRCFDRESVSLIGGHSSEGADLAIGFSVTGDIDERRIMRKGGLRPGDALVLTRPLGTGILFAAAMRAKARSAAVEAALGEMRRSNGKAAKLLVSHGATAMTDVTGFGLAGHLGEMLSASRMCASINLAMLPLYADALDLARAGIASTLLRENFALRKFLPAECDPTTLALLFDPQTAGGLLAGIPNGQAADCVAALQAAGNQHAAIVGHVKAAADLTSECRIEICGSIAEQP